MADKMMLNFRCPADLLDAIDAIGQQRHPSDSKHGCDRTKTLLDIVRAGIEALSDDPTVLQKLDNVRQSKTVGLASTVEELPEKLEPGDSAELPEVDNAVAEELQNELSNLQAENESLRQELAETLGNCAATVGALQAEIEALKVENETLRNTQPAAEFELPEASKALDLLRSKRKKSKADLGDVVALWEIIEESWHNRGN